MKPLKNLTTLALMGSSIFLLLVLQFFWLYNSYEKAYYSFRKDIDGIFRNTVMTLRDSAFLQFIEKIPSDSVYQSKSVFSQKSDLASGNGRTTPLTSGNTSPRQLSLVITSSSDRDSIKETLKSIVGKIHEVKMNSGNFIVRMDHDSIRLDSIRKYFSKSLGQMGSPLSFQIKKIQMFPEHDYTFPPKFSYRYRRRMFESGPATATAFSDTLKTDWVRTDPMNRYSAELTGIVPLILREITPQIFFSIFLTILTSAAFVVLFKSIQSQQHLMEIKNDFINNITHELKTPISTVSVALEALQNFKGLENPQRTQEYLNIAQSELNRLTILTDKILKTAIFENKSVDFEPEPVDLFKTMEQVLHSMKLIFDKQKAQISFEKTGNSFIVRGGSAHLTNVIYNLLDNALKYSEGEPHISISLMENDNRVTLSVADQGIGIPKEYSKKIFEKFFRVPAGNVHNVKGYGLGLSYVESVIRSHSGHIAVESEKGRGSVFTISLPKNLIGVDLSGA